MQIFVVVHPVFIYVSIRRGCSSTSGDLVSCSLFTFCLCSFICLSCGNDIYGILTLCLLACTNVGTTDGATLPLIIFWALASMFSYFFFILDHEAPPSSIMFFLLKTFLGDFVVVFLMFSNVVCISMLFSIWHISHGVFHPSMDVDDPFVWVCIFLIYWIISTIDFFNHSFFSQSTTLFAFLSFLSLNTYFLVALLLVVTLASTIFTFLMTVCISTIGWTSTIVTNFPWNIFCILVNFGQFVILCPFKP